MTDTVRSKRSQQPSTDSVVHTGRGDDPSSCGKKTVRNGFRTATGGFTTARSDESTAEAGGSIVGGSDLIMGRRRLEVLSPAGNWDSLVAAAESGADAVYFGGTRFSARQYADNFDDELVARAIDYLHVRDVRAYITVNTLIYGDELRDTLEFVARVYEMGADAIIVQDLGLAALIRASMPDLALHASTQMTAHNAEACRFLLERGFRRVVLARELGLDDIRRIRAQADVDLEVFVHGALCFSYSGQCLMSSMVGGRSGNRGRCAQPCRLEYSLVDREGNRLQSDVQARFSQVSGHLLSPSDLSLVAQIPELMEAGVRSFKIEGRMKKPEYVATVTRVFRRAVDESLDKGRISADVLEEIQRDAALIFNRGLTTAYYYGRPAADMMSPGRPSNRGAYLGRVKSVSGFGKLRRIRIALEDSLRRGDGIEVWVSKGGHVAKVVEEMFVDGRPIDAALKGQLVDVVVSGAAYPGDRVFKTYDYETMHAAREAYSSPKAFRKVPIQIHATARLGQPFSVVATDQRGVSAEAASDYIVERAERHVSSGADVEENLIRTGNSPFSPSSVTVNIDDGVMVPRSVVNDCRRRALALLESRRALLWHRHAPRLESVLVGIGRLSSPQVAPVEIRRPASGHQAASGVSGDMPGISVSTTTIADLGHLLEAGPDRVYLSLECYSQGTGCLWAPENLSSALQIVKDSGIEAYVRFPRIMKDADLEECVERLHRAIGEVGYPPDGLLIANLGLLRLATKARSGESASEHPLWQEWGESFALVGDSGLNVTNPESVSELADAGLSMFTPSLELRLHQIRALGASSPLPIELVVDGRIPLIVSEQCVIGYLSGCNRTQRTCARFLSGLGLMDRKGYVFPLLADQFCRTHILNSVDLRMIGELSALAGVPSLSLLRIEGYGTDNRTLASRVRAYRAAMESGTSGPTELEGGMALDSSGYTHGHYFRGAE